MAKCKCDRLCVVFVVVTIATDRDQFYGHIQGQVSVEFDAVGNTDTDLTQRHTKGRALRLGGTGSSLYFLHQWCRAGLHKKCPVSGNWRFGHAIRECRAGYLAAFRATVRYCRVL
jgi:hypothetical protein